MEKNTKYAYKTEWTKKNYARIVLDMNKKSEQEVELLRRLEFYAKESNKSRNQCIKEAIDEYLTKREY